MNTKLNTKQWMISTLAVFVIFVIFALIQGKVILPQPASADMQQTMPASDPMGGKVLVYVARLMMAGLFTYVFTKSSEGKSGIGHGSRYGLGIGLLIVLPVFIVGFEYSGLSGSTHALNKIVELLSYVVGGAVTAQLYTPTKA